MLNPGDEICLCTPGGGGYGDPLQRAAVAVLSDVQERKVSPKMAREQYGVAILPDGVGIDAAATAQLRATRKYSKTHEMQE